MRRSIKRLRRPWQRRWAAFTVVWVVASMLVLRNDIPSDPIEGYQPKVLDGRETLIGMIERTAIVLSVPMLVLAVNLFAERRRRREGYRVGQSN